MWRKTPRPPRIEKLAFFVFCFVFVLRAAGGGVGGVGIAVLIGKIHLQFLLVKGDLVLVVLGVGLGGDDFPTLCRAGHILEEVGELKVIVLVDEGVRLVEIFKAFKQVVRVEEGHKSRKRLPSLGGVGKQVELLVRHLGVVVAAANNPSDTNLQDGAVCLAEGDANGVVGRISDALRADALIDFSGVGVKQHKQP